MAQLEQIVATMETNETTLSDSLESYKKGVELIAECQKALTEVEKIVEQIQPNEINEHHS